jgi:hypothetical protein
MTLADDQLMSSAEVAAFFRRSERTIRAWDRAGVLHPHKVRRRKLYRWSDVARVAGLLPANDGEILDQGDGSASG